MEEPDVVGTNDRLAVVDFHSFRGLQVTSTMKIGQPSRAVMRIAHLASKKLLERYLKISQAEVTTCIEAMPLPKV